MARGTILIGSVFMGTALLGLANEAAGCPADAEDSCRNKIFGFFPSSLLTVMATISGVIAAIVMPLVGAIVDHTSHRHTVALWSAILLLIINAVQIIVGEPTWFAVAVLQTIGPVVFLVHLVVVYAYLPDLTDDWRVLTNWQGIFVSLRSLAMIIFLILTVLLAGILIDEEEGLQEDVAVARLSQVLLVTMTTFFFTGTFWDGLQPCEARQPVPEGRSVWSAGFFKLLGTMSKMVTKYRGFTLFCIGTVIDTSAISSVIVIAITYATDFLELNAAQNGFTILLFLLSSIAGCAAYPHIVKRMGYLQSLQLSDIVWGVIMVITSFAVRGPDDRLLFMVLGCLWGFCFGWNVPNGRMVYISMVPKGEEAEYMGLFQFFGRGFLWLPPLIFTALNESGVAMNYSLLVLPVCMFGGAIFYQIMGSLDKAIEETNGVGVALMNGGGVGGTDPGAEMAVMAMATAGTAMKASGDNDDDDDDDDEEVAKARAGTAEETTTA